MTKLPLVVVVWNDAWVRAEVPIGIAEVATEHKPEPVTTIGWVLLENETGISLANEYYDSTYRGRTFIPRAMIHTIERYTLTKPRTRHAQPPSAA